MSNKLTLFRYRVQFPLLDEMAYIATVSIHTGDGMRLIVVAKPEISQMWWSLVGETMRRLEIERSDAMRLLRPIASLCEEWLISDGVDPVGGFGDTP